MKIQEKKDLRRYQAKHGSHDKRMYLPPLAIIGGVCVLFICLFLVTGILYLQRSERILVSFLENQGLGITGVVQRLSQENLNLLVQAGQEKTETPYSLPKAPALYPKAWLTAQLADLGREVDKRWQASHLNRGDIKKFADEKGLWLVAIIDKSGRSVFQNRRLPKEYYLPLGNSSSPRELSLDLLYELAQQRKIGYIALQRKDGSGTVVIALDRAGLIYWGLKVAVEKAIEKLGEGQKQGLIYMTIVSRSGMPLGKSGRQPEKWRANDIPFNDLLSGTVKIASRPVVYLQKNILDIATPLYINGTIAGIVRIGLDKQSTDRILQENRRQLLSFLIFAVTITISCMWFLYRNQKRHLAGIVAIERSLEKAERLSALGQLAAGVAHEIRNPLNAISMASQRLKRDFNPPEEEKNREFQLLSGVIRDEIRRLNAIIEEFLSFSKSRRLELRYYPVTEVLQKIVNLIHEEAAAKGITIKTSGFSSQEILPMDMDKLQQALLNFVKNAMESIKGGGEITISVIRKEKERLAIRIADTGCGMSPAEMERIFNPEYTTKEKGLGLGLALAHEIIRGHGGEIRLSSAIDSGTTFEILLPTQKPPDVANSSSDRTGETT